MTDQPGGRSWKKLSTEVINHNPWTEFRHDRFQLPNGKESDYYYLHTDGSVAIVAVQSDGRVIMHHQYRYLFDRNSLELPAGGIKPNQSPDAAAKAELAEEAEVTARQWRFLGSLAPANGVFDELQHVFLAWDLEATVTEPDETESFELVPLTPAEIDKKIESNEMWDGFSIGPWALARPHVLALIESTQETV
jgi:ADP-ribose pyrophosphatase